MAAASGLHVEEFRASLISEVKKAHKKIYPHYLENETVGWDAKDFESNQ
jgi:GTP-binding protein HflX